MDNSTLRLDINATDGAARSCTVHLQRGSFQTPAFMPVATRGAMRGISMQQMQATGTQILLSNTFHLMDRPGTEIVNQAGGIQAFANWSGPVLTDSGGFQAFSLADITKKTAEGFWISSPRDGKKHLLSPQTVIKAQLQLQSDIAMVIDDCPALPATLQTLDTAVNNTIAWARECRKIWQSEKANISPHTHLFCIVQGGTNHQMRKKCATALLEYDWDGIAIGGLSVGEKQQEMLDTLQQMNDILPSNRPRYLMGVGKPIDLLRAISRGIDMFDCVLPARNGRNGHIYTHEGLVKIKNHRFLADFRPLDPNCPGPCCGNITRAYLHHLFRENEMLGPVLASLHNIYHYQQLMQICAQAIKEGNFSQVVQKYEKLES